MMLYRLRRKAAGEANDAKGPICDIAGESTTSECEYLKRMTVSIHHSWHERPQPSLP